MRMLLFCMVGACSSYQTAARAQFSGDATCPEDRVTVAHAPTPPPPEDIAADPGRLAVWNADAAKSTHYVARGCGQEQLYVCQNDGGSWPYSYSCMPVANEGGP